MTNFDEFKQKAKDTMETIADRSIELYKIAEEKTKVFAKMTKLGAEVALEKATVRKLYKEIGKKYYELHKASPEEELAQACTEVTSSLETIASKQKEIDELKASMDMGVKDDSAVETDEDDKNVEVKIIIEDLKKPGVDSDDTTESDAEDDIISNIPPEFKL